MNIESVIAKLNSALACHPNATPILIAEAIEMLEALGQPSGSWHTYLPTITGDVFETLGTDPEPLIEVLPDGKWNWTQQAVDFACIIPVNEPVRPVPGDLREALELAVVLLYDDLSFSKSDLIKNWLSAEPDQRVPPAEACTTSGLRP